MARRRGYCPAVEDLMGVGRTSLAEMIAQRLGRVFVGEEVETLSFITEPPTLPQADPELRKSLLRCLSFHRQQA